MKNFNYKKIFYFFIITKIIFILVLVTPGLIYGETSLENYSNSFSANLDKEVSIINDLVSYLESFNPDFGDSFEDLQFKLSSFKRQFTSIASNYNNPPYDAPSSLKSSVSDAIDGTNKISSGLTKVDLAIDSADSLSFESGLNQIDAGVSLINSAIDKYNNFVNEYNTEIYNANTDYVNEPVNTSTSTNNSYQEVEQENGVFNILIDITKKIGIPLSGLFFYLLLIGLILNKNFNKKLRNIVNGNLKITKFKSTGIYGFHLIVLFIFIYALLIFSFVLLADFVFIAIMFPISIIGLAIVAIGTIWALLKGIFGKQNKNIYGELIKKEDYTEIWDLSSEVSKRIGTNPPDEIYISPFYGIAVMSSGGIFHLLFNRTRRILIIDIASIKALSTDEFKAILAHEFGHFNNKDTKWNSLTFSMGYALQNTFSSLPSPWNLSGCITRIISIFNPVLWIMGLSLLLYKILSSGFSRIREVFADKTAIELYRSENFVNGLLKIVKANNQLGQSLLEDEKSSIFDTHPLLKDRIKYASYFDNNIINDIENNSKKESKLNSDAIEVKDIKFIFCKYCGEKIPNFAIFCKFCGKKIK